MIIYKCRLSTRSAVADQLPDCLALPALHAGVGQGVLPKPGYPMQYPALMAAAGRQLAGLRIVVYGLLGLV